MNTHTIKTSTSVVTSDLRMPSRAELRDSAQHRLEARQLEVDERMAAAGYVPAKRTLAVEVVGDELPEVAEERYLQNALGTLTSRQMAAEKYAGQRAWIEKGLARLEGFELTQMQLRLDQLEHFHGRNLAHHDECLAKYGWKRGKTPPADD
jgi:hypothetical protein